MRNATRYTAFAWPVACAVLVLLTSGCLPTYKDDVQADNEAELVRTCDDLKRENRDLKRNTQTLQDEKAVLEKTVEELRARERVLADRVFRLQQDVEKQKQMLDVLNDLPAERDAFKKQADELKTRVVELEMQLRELRGKAGKTGEAAESTEEK